MLVLGVVVLALALAARLAVTGDEEKPETKADVPGTANASYGNEWKTADGSRYEISVETLTDLVAVGSPDTCVAAPSSPAMTNLHFTIKIKNKGKKAAPVPEVRFGTNVQPSGAIDPTGLTFAKANKDLQITPLARAQSCKEGARLGPDDRAEIAAGQTETFTGTFGPTKLPITDGITVLVRYYEGSDKTPTDLLAPFGDFGS